MPIDARALAKAAGAAQRIYHGVVELTRATDACGGILAVQGNAVLEELDLLRYQMREATLNNVITPQREKPVTRKQSAKRSKSKAGRRP